MRNTRVVILALWLVSCLVGVAWLMVASVPAQADDPDTEAQVVLQTAKLFAVDWWAEEKFGFSVALGQDLLIIGTPEFTPTKTSPLPGAAYIFARSTDNPHQWNQVKKLTASDGAANDQFGYSVAIDGDTVVVGAPEADVNGRPDAGAAYVFYRNQGGTNNWGQLPRLTSAAFTTTDVYTNDAFATSVAIDGDTLVVGANQDNNGAKSDQGAAYVLYRNKGGPDNWGGIKKIRATDGITNDEFGISVSVDGNSLVVGAWQEDAVDANPADNEGAAYVLYRDSGGPDQWGEVQKIVASDRAAGDVFGWSVVLNGDTIVVGANRADVGGRLDQGAAYVYYRDRGGPDQWGQVEKVTASDGAADERFGYSVAVMGDVAVAGAFKATVGGHNDQGAAYTFGRAEGGADKWGQVAKLLARDGNVGDWFGFSVATTGNESLGGAPYANIGGQFNTGAAYVFIGNAQIINLPVIRK